MMRPLLLLSIFMLVPGVAGAKETQDATLLGCSFGAPGEAANADSTSQKLYVLYRLDERRNETISLIDPNSLLGSTMLKHRKTTVIDGGELWTFSEGATEPKGTILLVLPKSIALESGREARRAALGQYHGSSLRNGVCVIVRGDEAVTTFGELSGKDAAK
jgi:hypothetical protein